MAHLSPAVASGTAGDYLGLRLLGIKPSDEVFCSTLTFAATANPIIYLGAKPVFIDSNESTWNMDPLLLAEALHRRARSKPPRAVVVHLYGQCADMTPILEACSTYGVPVLEDAAESFGATYRGRPAGTLGNVGAISLNGNKIITASGGGLLVARQRDSITRVKHWAAQAREPGIGYEHRELGYNYCLSNVLAGIARGQLKVLDERIRRRREIASDHRAVFSDLPGIDLMPQCAYGMHINWLSCFLIDERAFAATRDDVIRILRRRERRGSACVEAASSAAGLRRCGSGRRAHRRTFAPLRCVPAEFEQPNPRRSGTSGSGGAIRLPTASKPNANERPT